MSANACPHSLCDDERLCACCNKHGIGHALEDCRPVEDQLRTNAKEIRESWSDLKPPAKTDASAWVYADNMNSAMLCERAAERIKELKAEVLRLAQRNAVLVAEIDALKERRDDMIRHSMITLMDIRDALDKLPPFNDSASTKG